MLGGRVVILNKHNLECQKVPSLCWSCSFMLAECCWSCDRVWLQYHVKIWASRWFPSSQKCTYLIILVWHETNLTKSEGKWCVKVNLNSLDSIIPLSHQTFLHNWYANGSKFTKHHYLLMLLTMFLLKSCLSALPIGSSDYQWCWVSADMLCKWAKVHEELEVNFVRYNITW